MQKKGRFFGDRAIDLPSSPAWGPAVGALDSTERFSWRRGAMSGGWPMDFSDGPARALEAGPLLEGSPDERRQRAAFLLRILSEDPDQLFSRPAGPSLPSPAPLSPFEWLWDPQASRWLGRAVDHEGTLFHAPLFGFWLLEAALSRHERPGAPKPTRAVYSPEGVKCAVPAWADLDWPWSDDGEPRLEMCALALRCAAEPRDAQALAALGRLLHPALAAQAANIPAAAWRELLSTAPQWSAIQALESKAALDFEARPAIAPARFGPPSRAL